MQVSPPPLSTSKGLGGPGGGGGGGGEKGTSSIHSPQPMLLVQCWLAKGQDFHKRLGSACNRAIFVKCALLPWSDLCKGYNESPYSFNPAKATLRRHWAIPESLPALYGTHGAKGRLGSNHVSTHSHLLCNAVGLISVQKVGYEKKLR